MQDKLRDEIKELYDEDGKLIYEKLIDHEYLDQVFHESLRLHPPAFILTRECTEAIKLEGLKGKGYQMQVGECVIIPVYSIQRDPGWIFDILSEPNWNFHFWTEYYPEPEHFVPERFDQEHGGVKAFKDKGVLLAFGDGPRICLGQRFALMQSKAAVAEIVRNFEISVNNKTQRPLIIDPKEFLNIKSGGLWLDFKPLN